MIKMKERRASIHPVKSKLKISILDDVEIDGINQATRDILEDVGISFPSVKAQKILADAGANVDFDTQIVKFPSHMVDKYLQTSPRSYDLCGRRPELDAKLGQGLGTHFYCSGEAPKIVDFETGERRLSVKRDVENMAKIANYLPIVSLVWPTVSASDKGEAAPLHGVEACFNNTEKHVQTESVMDEVSAKYAIEMASVVAGGLDELKKRPLHSILLCCIQPLAQDRGGIESALVYAEAGLPIGFMSMPTLGLTGPPYSAGALAMALAEVLSGVVLTQIVNPGTPTFITIIPSVIDPRSGNYFMGSSPAQITSAASVQLAHSNGVPITACMSFGGSQYKLNNWQAGIENFFVHFLTVMAGADMSFGPSGMIEAVSLLDMRRILFDREILQAIDIITDGFEVNEKTLAMDMIREVGPRGMFINLKRTAKEMRNLWPPSILFEAPKDSGEKYRNPVEVAHESIEWILKNHKPEPLPEEVRKEVRRLVAAADQDEGLKKEVRGHR
jgi:trimethylamine--corrinoid protein Co-methyltransferase